MAHGDKRGGSKASSGLAEAFYRAVAVEDDLASESANIVVGEFLSELQSAIRFRMKLGQTQGDWIEEPERAFTDGAIFAVEETVASQVKLQITVSLDASLSMWNNGIMQYAGPTFAALDRIIRASILDLPEGAVHYAPFIFHDRSFKIPQAFITNYTSRVDWGKNKDGSRRGFDKQGFRLERYQERIATPNFPSEEQWAEALKYGEVPPDAKRYEYKKAPFKVQQFDKETKKLTKEYVIEKEQYVSDWKLSGAETNIAPLFQAIKNWEEVEGDISATRLDIVITDGTFESAADVAAATRLQEERDGRLRTVLLNFLPMSEWENVPLPGRCAQFAVRPNNLDTSIRSILGEAIADLFA